MTCRYRP